jgi:guanylate kinase
MNPFIPGEASQQGIVVRRARAELKASIARGEGSILELFDRAGEPDADPVLRGLRVEWFLRSIPGVGVTKAQRLVEGLGINPRATLGGVRVRQRTLLRGEVQRLFRHYFPEKRGKLLVLVGPSGVGKGTIVTWILEKYPQFMLSVSATTRSPRPGERDGEHYFFVSEREFDRLVGDDELLEWATVHGTYRYGTPQAAIEDALDQGRHVILEIDIQGARQVKRKMKDAFTVFVAPPSFEELERRLAHRGTEDTVEREARLVTAKKELAAQDECNVVIVNRDVSVAAQSIVDLVTGSPKATLNEE